MTTTENDNQTTAANVTQITPARKSRATRSAAQNKPASKPAPKPASKSKAKANRETIAPTAAATATAQKRATAEMIITAVADALSANPPQGVAKADALRWAGEWLQYLPGVRQGRTGWDRRLGVMTGAGAREADSDESDDE